MTLRYLDDAIEVEVIDDGRPKHAPVGSRLGHVGIRERVALLGGESEIGPRPVGGFRVRARIPLAAPTVGACRPGGSSDVAPATSPGDAAPPSPDPVAVETDHSVQDREGAAQ